MSAPADLPTPELDAVDRILLHELAESPAGPGPVVVVEDATGALTQAVAAVREGAVRVWCDSLRAEHAARAALGPVEVDPDEVEAGQVDAGVFSDAVLVVLRIPKSLAALEQIAAAVARSADPSVLVLAGGRNKHLTRGMNGVLGRHFAEVRASLGRQNSRVLMATAPIPGSAPPAPRTERHPDLDLTLCAYGGVFAGASVDLGSRFLVGLLDRVPSGVRDAVDLGCGNGLLAVAVAQLRPDCRVLAVDDSRDAVRSAEATVAANGLDDQIEVRRADGLAGVATGSVDLVVCNPPFHEGTTRDSSGAYAMFADAARCLRPAGELWTVFNSHLPYLPAVRRLVGSTKVIGQNRQYTVTRSTRPTPR